MDITIKSFNGIGDLLFVTPTLQRIKEAYPNAVVTVNTNYPDLLTDNPYVDHINRSRDGLFLGYPDPIHATWPTQHHIISDWEIVKTAFHLDKMQAPELRPQIHCKTTREQRDIIGVQVIHKGHWHRKKVWPKFDCLASLSGFEPIPKVSTIQQLLDTVASYKAVVCAEGGISHIAMALGVPAIVIYGGFADPEWNGYREQINLVNEKRCSFCYHPGECMNGYACMTEITIDDVLQAAEGLGRIEILHNHNAMIFTVEDAKRWCRGDGVDVGGGKNPLPGIIRNIEDRGGENAYHIMESDGALDFVFSSHCIEHLDDPAAAVREWQRVVRPGGTVYIYFPSPHYFPWRRESMPKFHKHDLFVKDVVEMLNQCEIVETVHRDEFFGQKVIGIKKGAQK